VAVPNSKATYSRGESLGKDQLVTNMCSPAHLEGGPEGGIYTNLGKRT